MSRPAHGRADFTRIPGTAPEENHPAILVLLERRARLLQVPNPTPAMLHEAVAITESVSRLMSPRRSEGYAHGDSGYTGHGCRCLACCDAHADAQRRYRAGRATA